MAGKRVPLVSSAYAGQSIISSGQECVNLYAEAVPQIDPQAPVPVTYYQTPGTLLYTQDIANVAPARGSYRTSRGTAYYVVGQIVYAVTSNNVMTQIGIIANRPSQVKMKDNGLVVVLVDGVNGYVINMADNRFAQIFDPNFYGADYVELLDTFFIFNRPATNQFYISASNADFGMLSNSGIANGTLTNGGAGYVDGSYTGVPLTGGSGTGATADIVVSGGVATAFELRLAGVDYAIGDTLSVNNADLGGTGAGLVWTVNTLLSAFDPLDIAAKSGFNDPIVGITAVHRELQLIGNLTSEIWIGTGAADFYFQQVQGAFINHGCGAQYSIASQDVLVFFVQQDLQGNGLVLQLQAYDVKEISTPRIVKEFKSYPTLEDAIGFCYQIEDHAFYELVFPTAQKGWLYDLKTEQWSEKNWSDDNGNLLRPRENCCMFAFGKILVGDWQTGNLLEFNKDTFTDYSTARGASEIIRVRTFPHIIQDNARVTINSFDADMEVGTILDQDDDPIAGISLSYDRGKTYGDIVYQSLGKTGEYLKTLSWNRLGQGRDIIIKLQWSANCQTALNGGFIQAKRART